MWTHGNRRVKYRCEQHVLSVPLQPAHGRHVKACPGIGSCGQLIDRAISAQRWRCVRRLHRLSLAVNQTGELVCLTRFHGDLSLNFSQGALFYLPAAPSPPPHRHRKAPRAPTPPSRASSTAPSRYKHATLSGPALALPNLVAAQEPSRSCGERDRSNTLKT